MEQSNSYQTDPTGGSVPTGNPQNIGTQSLGAPSSDLQRQSTNLLNDSSGLRLTDQNGRPLNTTTNTNYTPEPVSSSNLNGVMTVTCIIVFIIVFIASWLLIKDNPAPATQTVAKAPVKKTKSSKKVKKSKKTKKSKKK